MSTKELPEGMAKELVGIVANLWWIVVGVLDREEVDIRLLDIKRSLVK